MTSCIRFVYYRCCLQISDETYVICLVQSDGDDRVVGHTRSYLDPGRYSHSCPMVAAVHASRATRVLALWKMTFVLD